MSDSQCFFLWNSKFLWWKRWKQMLFDVNTLFNIYSIYIKFQTFIFNKMLNIVFKDKKKKMKIITENKKLKYFALLNISLPYIPVCRSNLENIFGKELVSFFRIYLTLSPLVEGDTGSIFKWSAVGFSSKLVPKTRTENQVCLTFYSLLRGRTVGFRPFQRALARKERKQPCPKFKHGPPILFPTAITEKLVLTNILVILWKSLNLNIM